MNRRDFLRLSATGTLGAFLGCRHSHIGLTQPTRAESGKSPNVILILADDLGARDLGCYGAEDLYTPNLDTLAQSGVRFNQFYVASPICSPSRAALLTGLYPQMAGVPGNVSSIPNNPGLPAKEITLAEIMREAGYKTALFGKWHLGTANGNVPLDQGFDEFFGHKGGCIDNYSHYFYWRGPNRHDLWQNREEHWEEGTFFGDMIVREAARFMEENRNNPFFLYLPFNMPHYPEQAKPEFRKMYEDMEMPRSSYAAFVSTLDDCIGQVLDKVDELGLGENTLVVFMSDNGYSTEDRAFHGGGYNGSYRGAKFSLFEGGIRLPCIARMPGVIPEDEAREQLVTSLDWYATIASTCGVKLSESAIIGRDIMEILKSSDAPDSHESFHWQVADQWAVRDKDWKLIHNPVDTDRSRLKGEDKTFLVNLSEDISETTNLASQHPEKVKHLTELHEKWVQESKD